MLLMTSNPLLRLGACFVHILLFMFFDMNGACNNLLIMFRFVFLHFFLNVCFNYINAVMSVWLDS